MKLLISKIILYYIILLMEQVVLIRKYKYYTYRLMLLPHPPILSLDVNLISKVLQNWTGSLQRLLSSYSDGSFN